jgi:negative regulator of replication initiation
MHRLQISLPRELFAFLAERARRDGISMAELIRRLVKSEEEVQPARSVDRLWEIVGIGEERKPLISRIPVSERPDLYLSEAKVPRLSGVARRRRRQRRKVKR